MKTWEEISKDESGTIYKDWYEDGVRCVIMRGPCALCAYVGVPVKHPLSGFDYNDIPLSVHGGLTFSGEFTPFESLRGYWWYGWDYGHCDDYSFYFDKDKTYYRNCKRWLIEDVEKEVKYDAVYYFSMLIKLAEAIVSKKYKIVIAE